MNRQSPVEPWIFSKIVTIWSVILGIIVVTAVFVGGQVYWWQKAEAQKEQQQLQKQIHDLQYEIRALKNSNTAGENTTKKVAANPRSTKTKKNDQFFADQLGGAEKNVIAILRSGDMEPLARYVHPKRGIRFSPFAYVDLKKDLVFSSTEVAGFLHNHQKYTWGYNEENGLPIRLSLYDFYRTYIYDRPYADTNEVNYGQTTSSEFTTSNCFEIYPEAIIVEYRVSEIKSKENSDTNWRSIRLVFEKAQKKWYLTGIIHDQWLL
jgi:Membrane-bound metallopeptidase